MSRIEELEQKLREGMEREDWEGYVNTSEELLRGYIKKLETVFTVRRSNLPLIMATMRIYLKALGRANPLEAIIAETMANSINFEVSVEEVTG